VRIIAELEPKPQQHPICEKGGLAGVLKQNPDMILLITKDECPRCPPLREAVNKIAEEMKLAVGEVEFDKDGKGECPGLDEDLKLSNLDVGLAVCFKNGKELGRRKGTTIQSYDEQKLREILDLGAE
jgi:hypothetical protein